MRHNAPALLHLGWFLQEATVRKAGLEPYAAECEPCHTQQPAVEAFAVFHYSFLFLVFLSEFLKVFLLCLRGQLRT